jgi:hypothetical protein
MQFDLSSQGVPPVETINLETNDDPVVQKDDDKTHKLVSVVHAEEADIIKDAADKKNVAVSAYVRKIVVAVACADLGVENPGLPDFKPGYNSDLRRAAGAAGMSVAAFRKQAIANAAAAALGK